ncbi:hypothetical protein Pcinc_031768 [Petrolisthes cinctipes]|uniref:Androgen-dependent TFPI-regulating protein n=1 Tax=Petrolisthes cinctipes TaxID=88211 RepID=A0AAE1EVW2_PETCI|nr:hypothetical protein Pcinc_031768 [Petrolisthes cinctipes]
MFVVQTFALISSYHRLECVARRMRLCVTCWHGVLTGVYMLAVHTNWYLEPSVRGPNYVFDLLQYGSRFKYLTFLNGVLQCVFFGVCVLGDLAGWKDGPGRRSILQRLHNTIFTTLVFPLGVFVCFIFWGLYAVDRELIFPVSMDAWFPGWLNHIMHTLPLLAVLVEMCLVNHRVVMGRKAFLPIIVAYGCYLSWLCYVAYSAGIWVYPVFEVLEFKVRCVFLAALVLPNVFLVYLARKIHMVIWGSSKNHKKGKKQ